MVISNDSKGCCVHKIIENKKKENTMFSKMNFNTLFIFVYSTGIFASKVSNLF